MRKNVIGIVFAVALFVLAGCTLVIGDGNSMATEVVSSVEGVKVNP